MPSMPDLDATDYFIWQPKSATVTVGAHSAGCECEPAAFYFGLDTASRMPGLRPMFLQDRMCKSRSVCEAAWRRVAAELGATVSDVKARWKNLRDAFRCVLKTRRETSKSGTPADDRLDEEEQWIFFVRLLFLKDTMTGRS
ncbi:hypothetical protein HPB49_014407 [Dermacentor silvarum]|uniref:Uncharacterized protein n=1 Tax=Dermacentor silvarum TaxID=543639 RepID=A0ACB8DJG5_DERSI|nr:hypothetical protein HPB49_014407 [Dermacentor silvarum]